MKHLILVSFLLIYSIVASAQTDSVRVWNKWCAVKDSMVLFSEGNNYIEIYSPTLKPSEMKVKSLDRALRIGNPEIKGDTLRVLAMPFPSKSRLMRLAVLHAKTSRLIKTVEFSCDTIPELIATLGNLKGPEAKKKDILAQLTLKISFPGSLYSYPYTIKQYTFKISTPQGGATINVKGFFINNDILKQINTAPEGTSILFTGIKATCPECATRDLNDIKITIK